MALSKSTSYLHRIATIEYDLQGMIQAYGIEFIHWLADEIHTGRVNCKQSVDRWSADVALNKSYAFSHKAAGYAEHSTHMVEDDIKPVKSNKRRQLKRAA